MPRESKTARGTTALARSSQFMKMVRRRPLLWLLLLASIACGSGSDVDPNESDALFDPEHIVEVEIEITDDDWDELRNETRPLDILLGGDCLSSPFGSPFSYFPADVTVDGELFENVGVRKKGFLGSLDTSKPSLKIKLDEYEIGQELYGYERLTLNNNKQDPSHVRQCLSFQAFAAAGVPAPRCNFAHVTVNGENMGVFTNVESVKKQFLARHYPDNDGMLFEGTLSDFRESWNGTFEAKTRKDAPDFSAINALTEVLATASDSELFAELESLIDIDAFITYWATEALIAHGDGYANNTNNFFLYQNPSDGRLEFLPWGTDGTFRHFDGPRNADNDPPRSVYLNGILARRLYDIAEVRSDYYDRLTALFDQFWDEGSLQREIDRMALLVAPLAANDPLHGERDFGIDMDPVRDFVDKRRELLEPEIQAPPTWDRPLRDSFCFEEIGTVTGTFDTTYGTLAVEDIFSTGTGTFDATLEDESIPSLFVGSKAGTDDQDANLAQIQLASFVDATLGAEIVLVLGLKLPLTKFSPGTYELDPFQSILIRVVPAQNEFELIGFVGTGTITLTAAGTGDTDPVLGDFSVTVMSVPF